MSAFVVGVRLVSGNGTFMEFTTESDPDMMKALLPGVGVMGVYTEITIKAIPMFRARQVSRREYMCRMRYEASHEY